MVRPILNCVNAFNGLKIRNREILSLFGALASLTEPKHFLVFVQFSEKFVKCLRFEQPKFEWGRLQICEHGEKNSFLCKRCQCHESGWTWRREEFSKATSWNLCSQHIAKTPRHMYIHVFDTHVPNVPRRHILRTSRPRNFSYSVSYSVTVFVQVSNR